MLRFPFATVGILLGGLVLATPVLAGSTADCRTEMIELPNGHMVDRIELQADLITAQLKRRGYDVEGVESWGGCVKAFVNEPGGSSHIMFFDPDTLEPLSTN
jgi:hypothetical protein